jgi:hypothetical protein
MGHIQTVPQVPGAGLFTAETNDGSQERPLSHGFTHGQNGEERESKFDRK